MIPAGACPSGRQQLNGIEVESHEPPEYANIEPDNNDKLKMKMEVISEVSFFIGFNQQCKIQLKEACLRIKAQ